MKGWVIYIMTRAEELQNVYVDLYIQFRNYVWNFDTIEALADLETAVYQKFPDIDDIKKKFKDFKKLVSSTGTYNNDEELKEAFSEFEDMLDKVEEIFADIETYEEVIE